MGRKGRGPKGGRCDGSPQRGGSGGIRETAHRWTEGGRQVNITQLWAELHGRTNGAPASKLQRHCTIVIIRWQKAPTAVSRREVDPMMLVGTRWRRTLTRGGEGEGLGDERTSRWILTDARQIKVRKGEGAPHLVGSRPGVGGSLPLPFAARSGSWGTRCGGARGSSRLGPRSMVRC